MAHMEEVFDGSIANEVGLIGSGIRCSEESSWDEETQDARMK